MHALFERAKPILFPCVMLACILCTVHISCAQDDTWTLKIQATGQVIEGALNNDHVYIGIADHALTYPHPPLTPAYTVYTQLSGNLQEDYREAGSLKEVWGLSVWIESKAEADLPGFFPDLSWDTNDIDPNYRMELRLNNECGPLVVEDMRMAAGYQTKEGDAFYYSPGIDMARISYSIVFRRGIWYWDADGDGTGDPNRWVLETDQPSGYVANPCDCDDNDPTRFGGNSEVCDGKDNDCDGIIPSDETTDADEDGYVACKECDDSDPNTNPMRGVNGESLLAFENSKNVLRHFAPSCESSTTYEILEEFRDLGYTISMRYTTSPLTPYYSTYWFFGRICGRDIVINDDPWDGEVFIIDRSE